MPSIAKFGDKSNCHKYWLDYFISFILYIVHVSAFN